MDKKNSSTKDVKQKALTQRPRNLRKVISSKNLMQYGYGNGKSCSTGIFGHTNKPSVQKPKKTTKSDQTFNKNMSNVCLNSDICKQCGDIVVEKNSKICNDNYENLLAQTHSYTRTIQTNESVPSSSVHFRDNPEFPSQHQMRKQSSYNIKNKNIKSIHQYYKNEKFARTSESEHVSESKNKLKPSLSTIREAIESSHPKSKSSNTLYQIYPESSTDDMRYFEENKKENIKEINEFRRRNYFECHSAESRVNMKSSTTSLGDHKCFYRFYLNDRLFPVPLKTDYHQNIRCVECKLPFDESRASQNINGTIQAKVKLNNKVQDMILMLPVNEPLIIKERRKELQNVTNPEVLYFGIIKLNANGDSVFNSTIPSNSFALKYQKGYKKYNPVYDYKYVSDDKEDIIII